MLLNFKKVLLFAVAVCCCMVINAKGHKEYAAKGDVTINVFEKENVRFVPDKYGTYAEADADGVIHLVNGRIILKKISVPTYDRTVKVTAKVTVASNGDRWDKSGSCFVLPKDAAINLMSIAKGENKFPEVDEKRYEKLVGVVPGKDYLPTVELLRFMTPFGVGHFSSPNDTLTRHRRPVYVPKWEDCVEWQQDITDLYPLLEGEAMWACLLTLGLKADMWHRCNSILRKAR